MRCAFVCTWCLRNRKLFVEAGGSFIQKEKKTRRIELITFNDHESFHFEQKQIKTITELAGEWQAKVKRKAGDKSPTGSDKPIISFSHFLIPRPSNKSQTTTKTITERQKIIGKQKSLTIKFNIMKQNGKLRSLIIPPGNSDNRHIWLRFSSHTYIWVHTTKNSIKHNHAWY